MPFTAATADQQLTPLQKAKKKATSKGRAVIRSPRLQEEQAALMMARRLQNRTIKELATDFNCSTTKLSGRLRLAQRLDLYDRAKEIVAGELVPVALQVYKTLMASAEEPIAAELATNVLVATGVMPKGGPAPGELGASGPETLEMWRATWTKRREVQADVPTDVEGQVIEAQTDGREDVALSSVGGGHG